MSLRIPFFGLLSPRSPMTGLKTHYAKVAEGLDLIEEALSCYIEGQGVCKSAQDLASEVDRLEDEADKIKRNLRNHLPMGLLMPVDKVLFLNYTRSQDNILDDAQAAMSWLTMRSAAIPTDQRAALMEFLIQVTETVRLLHPALDSAIDLVTGARYDRQGTKDKIRAVRLQHALVRKSGQALVSVLLNSGLDFRDVYQLTRFIECLGEMSHNTEGCADLLRNMISR